MVLFNFGHASIGFHHLRSLIDIFTYAITGEPRFNQVAGDRPNLFVKLRVRYIENLDITNLRETTKLFVILRS